MRSVKELSNRTRHRQQYGACTLHVRYIWLQTHSQNINTYCFSMAKVAARKHASKVRFTYAICLVDY